MRQSRRRGLRERAADVGADGVDDLVGGLADPRRLLRRASARSAALRQDSPRPTMNMLITRIVTSAKIEETRPAPMSTSAPAASPTCWTRSSARFSSLPVMSYFSLASRSCGFSSNAWLSSWAYSGRLLASFTPCSTAGGMRISPIRIGQEDDAEVDDRDGGAARELAAQQVHRPRGGDGHERPEQDVADRGADEVDQVDRRRACHHGDDHAQNRPDAGCVLLLARLAHHASPAPGEAVSPPRESDLRP